MQTPADIIAVLQKLPPNTRMIGVGPDGGGYDATTGEGITVKYDTTSGIALLGYIDVDADEDEWLGLAVDKFKMDPETYHGLRAIQDSLGGHKIDFRVVCDKLRIYTHRLAAQMGDPVAVGLRGMFTDFEDGTWKKKFNLLSKK